jgi:hypothetical protein
MYVKHWLNDKEQHTPSFNHTQASQSPSHSGLMVTQSWGLDASPSLNNKTLLSWRIAAIVSWEGGAVLCLVFLVSVKNAYYIAFGRPSTVNHNYFNIAWTPP